jgi:Acetyltransferase (GNAT) domain
MEPVIRPYDAARDREAIVRNWREIGWLRGSTSDRLDDHLSGSRALVAELDGEAEVLVTTYDATLRHGTTDLSMAAVTSVTASHVARQGGVAGRLTARALAEEAGRGLALASLGIFDQGYYDRFGFATGGYGRRYRLDPRLLRVPFPSSRPVRLGLDDWEEVHANRLSGLRGHGGCAILDARFTKGEIGIHENSFGLGFRDRSGRLTHHLWMFPTGDPEQGPFLVLWFAFETTGQLRELFGLLRSLGDQVHQFDVPEPFGVQVQRLLDRPVRSRDVGTAGERPGGRTLGGWQFRPLDLAAMVEGFSLAGEPVRFTLEVDDPVEDHLPADGPWRGVAGAWTVNLGEKSSAEPGRDARLPVLRCGVATFSRLWLGVVPVSRLPVTDDLDAPDALLDALDRLIALREPQTDFPF